MTRPRNQLELFRLFAVLTTLFMITGCSTPMALTGKTPNPVVNEERGLVLMVIETTKDNVGGLKRMPVVGIIDVTKDNGEKAGKFRIPIELVSGDKRGVFHLISFSLPAGVYKLSGMNGYGLMPSQVEKKYGKYPLGNFSFPLNIEFSSSAKSIQYVGHIDAHMRHRDSNNEIGAGALVPLLDQQVAGFYPTTFDIELKDQYEKDCDRFSDKFPDLKTATIEKRIHSK